MRDGPVDPQRLEFISRDSARAIRTHLSCSSQRSPPRDHHPSYRNSKSLANEAQKLPHNSCPAQSLARSENPVRRLCKNGWVRGLGKVHFFRQSGRWTEWMDVARYGNNEKMRCESCDLRLEYAFWFFGGGGGQILKVLRLDGIMTESLTCVFVVVNTEILWI